MSQRKIVKEAQDNNALIGQIAGELVTHKTSSDHDGQYYTESEVAAFLAIGAANKRWCQCILEGPNLASTLDCFDAYRNIGAGDMHLSYGIPLECTKGSGHNLVITDIQVGVSDADEDDYIDRLRLAAWDTDDPPTTADTLADDNTNRTAADIYTYGIADQTIGGTYVRPFIMIDCANAGALQLDIAYVRVEYYYT